MSDDPILKVSNIETYYGPIMAIRGVSLRGAARADRHHPGRQRRRQDHDAEDHLAASWIRRRAAIEFEGRAIQRMDPDKIVRLGISHVPEGREVFPFLTVRENLRDGRLSAPRPRRRRPGPRDGVRLLPACCKERADQRAGSLSGGEQQMLAISRALMARPQAAAARRAVARPVAACW